MLKIGQKYNIGIYILKVYMPQILKFERGKMMEVIIYAIIFIIGTLFGSFFTLAIYRIPLGLNIIYGHSFCPNCKNKLKFKDLIPIISYITLGGRCRYCKEKVRIRYLLLEVLSGFTFLLFVLSLKIDILFITTNQIIDIMFYFIYISTLFIIAGIDKENFQIQKSVLNFGLILSILFMIYVCISERSAIYTYIILICMIIFLLILDTIYLKKKSNSNYTINILLLSLYMMIFTKSENYYYSVALTLLLISLKMFIQKVKVLCKKQNMTNKEKTKELKIPIGFYLCVSNIILLLVANFAS